MPVTRFQLIDKRFITRALVDVQTRAGIALFGSAHGVDDNGDGNKTDLANRVLDGLYAEGDDAVIDLLNYLFVENPYMHDLDADVSYQTVKSRVLDVRGIELSDAGFVLSPAVEPFESGGPPPQTVIRTDGIRAGLQEFARGAQRVTQQDPIPATTDALPAESARDSSVVFVVHGRDTRPVTVIEQFLTFAGLRSMPWSEARQATGKSQPTTYEIVSAGMARAAAVVVIFSPDDEARVKPEYAESATDPDLTPRGQPRQNVTLEAGMAYASAPSRTIFVSSASFRPISDIDGFNWVKLDGEWDSRNDMIGRLHDAEAEVRLAHENLMHHTAGTFKVI
jgi:predicted nucleotide-binding protein